MGLFCILNNKLLRSLFVLIYAKNYVLLKNEFSQDMTQIHWADGRWCCVGPYWLHFQGTAVGVPDPEEQGTTISKSLELLVWHRGVTHKKIWIFSNTSVKTSNIAIELPSLLYWVVRRCRLVLGYNLHGITSNYDMAADRNIASILMFSLICNDRSFAFGDLTSTATHKIWGIVVVPKTNLLCGIGRSVTR